MSLAHHEDHQQPSSSNQELEASSADSEPVTDSESESLDLGEVKRWLRDFSQQWKRQSESDFSSSEEDEQWESDEEETDKSLDESHSSDEDQGKRSIKGDSHGKAPHNSDEDFDKRYYFRWKRSADYSKDVDGSSFKEEENEKHHDHNEDLDKRYYFRWKRSAHDEGESSSWEESHSVHFEQREDAVAAEPQQSDRRVGLLIIFSRRDNFEVRKTIRQTWANRQVLRRRAGGPVLGPFFIVTGFNRCDVESENEGHNSTLAHQLHEEQQKYWDVLTFQGEDDIRKRSDKFSFMLEWIYQQHSLEYFGRVPLKKLVIIKTNDDAYINVDEMINMHTSVRDSKEEPFIMCKIRENTVVDRNPDSDYSVSKERYPSDTYAKQCIGGTFVFDGSAHDDLRCAATTVRPFPDENIYVSVFVADKAKVELVEIPAKNSVGVIPPSYSSNGTTSQTTVKHDVGRLCELASQPLHTQVIITPVTGQDLEIIEA